MKKLILFAAIFAATNLQAQKVDTVYKAIQISPIVVNALKKDTAYQLTWRIDGVHRNDSLPAVSVIQVFNRKGRRIMEDEVTIPASVLAVWLANTVIDDYIMAFYGITKRK